VGYAERAVEHLVTVPLSSTTHWSRSRTAGIEGRAAADFYAAEGIEATVQDKHETEAYITFAVPNADMPMSPDEAASWFRKLSRRASDPPCAARSKEHAATHQVAGDRSPRNGCCTGTTEVTRQAFLLSCPLTPAGNNRRHKGCESIG
jgi:hypothetical protein